MSIGAVSAALAANEHRAGFSTQVRLVKEGAAQIVYIPSHLAQVGKTVKIQREDGTWDDGWQVKETYTKLPTAYVQDRANDFKRTRKASDA